MPKLGYYLPFGLKINVILLCARTINHINYLSVEENIQIWNILRKTKAISPKLALSTTAGWQNLWTWAGQHLTVGQATKLMNYLPLLAKCHKKGRPLALCIICILIHYDYAQGLPQYWNLNFFILHFLNIIKCISSNVLAWWK